MASKKPRKPDRATQPSNAPDIPTARRLQYAQNVLASVRYARTDYVGQRNPTRRIAAVRSFISEGVSFTWTLQNMRHREADFEEWYQPWATALKDDPVANFFYTVRVPAIHEGQLDLGPTMHISRLDLGELNKMLGPLLPPGRFNLIIGDASEGGTSYAVGSDGKRLYFDVPGMTTWEWIHGVPDDLKNTPLPVLMDRYIALLERIQNS